MTNKRIKFPKEILPAIQIQKIIIDFMGVIVLLIGVNAIAGLYLHSNTTNWGYWIIRQKWDLLNSLQNPVDWLILGDSTCNQSVVPSVLERELSGKALNLCTIANMLLVDDYFMLTHYIDEFGPPANVVLVHVYDVWHRPGRYSKLGKFLPWGYWSDFSPPITLEAHDYKDIFISYYWSLFFFRFIK